MTEVAFLRSTQQLGNTPISQYTIQELTDITGAVTLLANLQNLTFTAQNMAQTLSAVSGAVQGNSSITNFIASAAVPGQTSQGPGDLGNYYPFTQGNSWDYQTTVSQNGEPTTNFTRSIIINGSKDFNGAIASVFVSGIVENYLLKDGTGITLHGSNVTNSLPSELVPIKTVHFPLHLGLTIETLDKKGLFLGEDIDGDGINDTLDITDEYTVTAMEPITVPAGIFQNSARIESREVQTYHSSAFGITATVTTTQTEWVAPGIGFVSSIGFTQSKGLSQDFTVTITEELTRYSADGQTGGTGGPPPPPPPPTPVRIEISPPIGFGTAVFLNQSKQLQAIAYGQLNDQFPGLTYTWQSTDPSVLVVDPNGLITGRTPGKAIVTAISSGLTSNALTFTVNNGKLLSLATNDIVYDKISQKIFASIRSDSPTNPDTITVIEPVTGNTGPFVSVGVQPNKLTTSQDGQFLYVGLDGTGSVRRIQLPGLTTGPTFSLGTGIMAGCPTAPLLVDDMEVLPGSSQSIAVSRRYAGGCSPWHFGIAIFDNGIQRAVVTPSRPLANIIEFSGSSSVLYGLDGESDGSDFTTMTLDSSGASITKQTLRQFSTIGIRQDMVYEGGRIYTNDGGILDPVTHTSLGQFPNPGPDILLYSVRPDSSLNRVFFIARSFFTGALYLASYDKSTMQLLGTEEIDLANDGRDCTSGLSARTSLFRWGVDGLAFRTNGCHVVLLRSTLVQ
jgi:hypothetical protein